ncbi:cadmium-translocating P-type ATPase [Salinimonas marina]|uniref:Cadmium-translocating P-type ATPase n=1 Tax=Salinimonas marina TaxID=2785918 RepID=A0A7S9E041_9ALTE|nr:heavy metal translocating P-type ATPase [Salinimonas marina]QPG07022.1 cadmium-translocating P-type ATPase [Salinimonas marina]
MPPDICFHCHQRLPENCAIEAEVLAQTHRFCCYGCQAVAQAIVANGLEDYYRFRTQPAAQARDADLMPSELALFDDPELQQDFVHHDGDLQEIELTIEGISCAACGWLIEKQLSKTAGVRQIAVNVSQRRALLRWNSQQTRLSTLLARLKKIGYQGFPFQPDEHEASYHREQQQFVKKLGLAGIMTMQVMMLMAAHYFDWLGNMTSVMRQYFNWIALLLTTPVVVYCGSVFYTGAVKALTARTVNMDVPITLAIVITYLSGLWATWQQTGQVFFESICMFIFLLLLSRFIEHKSRYQAMQISANMLKYMPVSATKVTDHEHTSVLARKLLCDDRILIRAGEIIPVDGSLIGGSTYVDEAMLTGESTPVAKHPGDTVFGGTLNREHSITIKVTATLNASLISQIVRLQSQAMASRPAVAVLADKLATGFVTMVLLIAAATFGYWYTQGNPEALWITVAVLVATCPCALGLATPTALTCAMARLNRWGVLLKRSDILETLAAIDTIAFDKTGTLTRGDFRIVQAWYAQPDDADAVLSMACQIEQHSSHPLAMAFTDITHPQPVNQASNPPLTVQTHPGSGLSATCQQNHYKIGSPGFTDTVDATLPFAANVLMTCNDTLIGAWHIADTVKPDVHQVLQTLNDKHCCILSGDSQPNAQSTADELGIQTVYAGLTPAAKLITLKRMQHHQHQVMMVGDGINDAPVLSQANVSVAVGNGTDIAKASADIIFLNESLSALPGLFKISKQTRRIIRQNFGWALGYNICVLPLAVSGVLQPWMAVVGMSLSSIIVIINSTRLIRIAG